MTTATAGVLAKIAFAEDIKQAHASESSQIVEPLIGERAATRLLAALANGQAEPEDAWPLLCGYLHHWPPSEDPRLKGFVVALARVAAEVPQINFSKVT